MDVFPPLARTSVNRKDSFREESVRREISIWRSSSSNWRYAVATLLTTLKNTAFCLHSVASRLARADSVALRYLPQKSSSQKSDRFTWTGLASKGGVILVPGKRSLLAD